MITWVWINNGLYHRIIYSTILYFENWAVGKHYNGSSRILRISKHLI